MIVKPAEPPKAIELMESEIEQINQKYSSPVKYPKTVITDKNTGNTYNYINFDGYMAEPPYANKQLFNYDGTKFVFKNKSTLSIYEYDMVNETIMFLDRATCVYVAPTDRIYYCKDGAIWCMDWNTYEKRHVCDSPINEYLLVSTDEKYASGTTRIQSFKRTGRQNLVTGEVEWIEHDFSANSHTCGIGHTNVNPGYPEYLFFCNEGVTTKIPDRLWMHNYKTNKTWNFFVQAGEEGSIDTKETSGHEAWNMSGDYMYWVKYSIDGNLGQSGLMRKDKEGKYREYLNGDYAHWHCYPSGDDNWIASDINQPMWGKGADVGGLRVALTNANTYESWPIAFFECPFGNHPYHPHPHINYGSTVIQWGMIDENNVLGIAWMDISRLTKDGRKNTEITLNNNLSVITNEKYANFKVAKTELAGEKCFAIEPKNKMFVKVIDDELLTNCKNTLELEITYLDADSSFDIVYTSAIKSRMDLANRENKSITVDMKGTNTWKTLNVVIDDVALNHRCSHLTDFVIKSNSDKLVYIKEIVIKD